MLSSADLELSDWIEQDLDGFDEGYDQNTMAEPTQDTVRILDETNQWIPPVAADLFAPTSLQQLFQPIQSLDYTGVDADYKVNGHGPPIDSPASKGLFCDGHDSWTDKHIGALMSEIKTDAKISDNLQVFTWPVSTKTSAESTIPSNSNQQEYPTDIDFLDDESFHAKSSSKPRQSICRNSVEANLNLDDDNSSVYDTKKCISLGQISNCGQEIDAGIIYEDNLTIEQLYTISDTKGVSCHSKIPEVHPIRRSKATEFEDTKMLLGRY